MVMSLRLCVRAWLIPAQQLTWAHHAVIVWHCVQDASVVPSAEDFEGWPDAPLLVRPAPLDYQQVHSDAPGGAVHINDGGCAPGSVLFMRQACMEGILML